MTTNTQTNRSDSELIIKDVKAYPTSFPIPPGDSVQLGMGRAVKKDAVVVKVTTEGGLVGYGECHHGKRPHCRRAAREHDPAPVGQSA